MHSIKLLERVVKWTDLYHSTNTVLAGLQLPALLRGLGACAQSSGWKQQHESFWGLEEEAPGES